MAPEQLEARPTDARADIFAFGAIVYEMATGQQAFTGYEPGQHHRRGSRARSGTAVGLSHATATRQAGQRRRRPPMPWLLNQIVARCLAKNPDDRFQTAADLGQALRWMAESGSPTAGADAAESVARLAPLPRCVDRRRRAHRDRRGGGGRGQDGQVRRRRQHRSHPTARSVRFVVTPPPNAAFSPSSASFALSPDGRALAFTASAGQSGLALWLQSLDSLEAKRVAGTEGAGQIFWSPDSRTIAFADTSAEFKPKTVDLDSGVVRPLAASEISGVGAWSAEHGIIANHRGVIQRIPCRRRSADASHQRWTQRLARPRTLFPSFIADGRSFMFLARSTKPEHDNVAYMSDGRILRSRPLVQQRLAGRICGAGLPALHARQHAPGAALRCRAPAA